MKYHIANKIKGVKGVSMAYVWSGQNLMKNCYYHVLSNDANDTCIMFMPTLSDSKRNKFVEAIED